MKKVFKLAAIAAIACFTVVACNNNQPKVEDTTSTDTTLTETEELICDPIEDVEEAPVAEEQTTATQPKKPSKNTSTKKEESKPVVTKSESNATKTTEQKIQEKVDNLKNDGNTTGKTAPIKGRR